MTEYAAQVERISANIARAYAAVEEMGGTFSDTGSDHLAAAILTIPTVTTQENGAQICTIDLSGITDEPYPRATLLFGEFGFGIGGYGETPYGGSDLTLIQAAYVYGGDTLTVYAPRAYADYTNVRQIGGGVFLLTTGEAEDTTTLTLMISSG